MFLPPSQRLKSGALALIIAGILTMCAGCSTGSAALVKVTGGSVALTHVRVIDGTGGPAKEDQTIVIERGLIREMGDADAVKLTGVTQTMELRGRTVIPGLVGMHDHLFYALPPGTEYRGMPSFPRLYLATGVTSVRTAGATDLTAELQVKKLIDSGRELGPPLQTAYLTKQKQIARIPDVIWGAMLKKEMEFECAFVDAGGLLMAGVDPTGWGGVLAGFGDQHGLELLVEAGFTPEQAVRIARKTVRFF